MSYSITFRAATKAAAKTQAATEFDKVVAEYPSHAADRAAALANATSVIDLLVDDPEQDVRVSMNGFLAGPMDGGLFTSITQGGITTNAGLVKRAEPLANGS